LLPLRGGDLIEPRLLGLSLVVLLPVALEHFLQLAAGLAVYWTRIAVSRRMISPLATASICSLPGQFLFSGSIPRSP
jgi:hypothetical protein